MRLLLVAAGWAGVAAIAAATRLAADRLDADPERFDSDTRASHLEGQACPEASLTVELADDPLELRGTLRATVVADAPLRWLHAVAETEVEIESVVVDGVQAGESAPWFSALVAASRTQRRFKAARRARTPAADVTIGFRRALTRPGGEPLPCAFDAVALVELAADGGLTELEVVVPEGVGLVTGGPAPEERIERGPGRHLLGPWRRGEAPLVIGRVRSQPASADFGPILYVGAGSDLPDAALERAARERLLREMAPVEGPPRAVLFRPGLERDALVELGGGWFAAAPPRDAARLAHVVLASALSIASRENRDPLVAALPAALLLDGCDPVEETDPAPAAPRTRGADQAGRRAWRALGAAFGASAREAARELLARRLGGEEGGQPAFLDQPDVRAILRWVREGADVRLGAWRVDALQGRAYASGEIVVVPPPPVMLKISLLLVGDSRMAQQDLLVGGERTRFEGFALPERPRLVAIDPKGVLPHRGGAPPAIPLEVTPVGFAVAPDASALAVALVRGGPEPIRGVSVLRTDSDGALVVARWEPLAHRAASLEWAVAGRSLVVTDRVGTPQLLDVQDGTRIPFEGSLAVAPRRGFLVESHERAPGSFSHTLHDLVGGISWPIPVARRGPVRWLAGGDDLVVAGVHGRATIVDRRGRPRHELPLLLRSARILRRESFGLAAAVDTLTGGRVTLFDGHGREFRSMTVEGRVLGLSFVPDSGALLVFTQSGPGAHEVTRIEIGGDYRGTTLYRGPDRPLPDAPARRGLLFVRGEREGDAPDAPRRLEFVPFESLGRGDSGAEGEQSARLVSADALLEPGPVAASAGRYLYYLRARGGPRALPGELLPRALHRYDFLAGREEPLEIEGR